MMTAHRIIIILLLCMNLPQAVSQDIFGCGASLKWAEHLSRSQRHEEAAQEYLRLSAICKPADTFLLLTLRQFRLAGLSQQAVQAGSRLQYEVKPSRLLLREYRLNQLISAHAVDENADTDSLFSDFLQMNLSLLNGRYEQAENELYRLKQQGFATPGHYESIIAETKSFRKKSPVLAASLSGLLPGVGRIYTGDYYDAFNSFALVASNSFVAWRGFRRNGSSSALGWISAGLATGFYIGNIYGSAKSANKHNKRFSLRIHDQVLDILRVYQPAD